MNILQFNYLSPIDTTTTTQSYLTGDNVSTLGLIVMYIVGALLILLFFKMTYSLWLQNTVDKSKKK
jgi:hypothetical protein